MSLHTHKARFQPGAAEVVVALLVCAALAGIGYATLGVGGAVWAVTDGRVVSAQLYEPASTALAMSQLVRVEYTFTVDGKIYNTVWDGDWPRSYSPNALSGAELNKLSQPGYPLFVWYNPSDPFQSSLHEGGVRRGVVWQRLILWAAFMILASGLGAYPTLKDHLGSGSD